MRASALLQIIHDIDKISADDVVTAKQKFKQLVRAVGISHGVKGVGIDERIAFAQRLLESKVSRATVRDRLIARYGIGAKQAYRAINEALKLGHISTLNDTPEAEN